MTWHTATKLRCLNLVHFSGTPCTGLVKSKQQERILPVVSDALLRSFHSLVSTDVTTQSFRLIFWATMTQWAQASTQRDSFPLEGTQPQYFTWDIPTGTGYPCSIFSLCSLLRTSKTFSGQVTPDHLGLITENVPQYYWCTDTNEHDCLNKTNGN